MQLKGKIAIVTGASAGMGRAIAKRFALEGADVVALARRMDKLQEVAGEVSGAAGHILPLKCDVTVPKDIDRAVEYAVDQYGKLDILVNNAGIMDDFSPVEEVTDELWDLVMKTNLDAPFRFMRKAIPIMEKNVYGGSIIVVSSIGGIRGGTAGAAYIASKHGAVGLVKAAGYTCIDKKIRVNAILPGSVASDISDAMAAMYGDRISKRGYACSLKGMNLIPRAGRVEEIAGLTTFLASEDASFINGATIVADGGWCAY